jgi:hypothetical protein
MAKVKTEIQKWRRHLKIILHDLSSLLVAHEVMWETIRIYQANPELKNMPDDFLNVMFDNYVARLTVGIRRLTDKSHQYKKAVSLYLLIDDIKSNYSIISRKFHISTFPKWMKEEGMADRDFDKFAGKGESFLNIHWIEFDLKKICKTTKKIRTFVDKWIAHTDFEKRIRRLPVKNDVEKTLKNLEKIFCKYYGLINLRSPGTLPLLRSDWKEVFTKPWLPKKPI